MRAETLYFVPLGETLEVWRLRVRNERDTPADLSVFSSVEFCLWDAQDDATNFQRNFSTGEVEVADGVIYHKTEYRERRNHFAYFACSEPLAGLSVLTVRTPDEDTDRMVNIWNPYQCAVTLTMSRSVSLFESGISRGIGFRDSCQDLLGFVPLAPGRARARILELAATQLASGGAYHQYQPLTKSGNDAIGSGFNDDPLWLVLGVAAYLKETGDEAVLDELVPYADAQDGPSPLYEHLERSLRYTSDRLGPHLLPLIGRADWNDCLNLNCFSTAPGESFQTTANEPAGSPSRCSPAGCSCSRPRSSPRSPSGAGEPRRPAATGPRRRRWPTWSPSTAGTASGSAAPTTIQAAPSARRRTPKGRSSSNRRACA